MYYQPDALEREWTHFLAENDVSPDAVDPDAFVRWTYRRALARREPIYRAIAERWGVSVAASDVAAVADAEEGIELIAGALEAKA